MKPNLCIWNRDRQVVGVGWRSMLTNHINPKGVNCRLTPLCLCTLCGWDETSFKRWAGSSACSVQTQSSFQLYYETNYCLPARRPWRGTAILQAQLGLKLLCLNMSGWNEGFKEGPALVGSAKKLCNSATQQWLIPQKQAVLATW